MIATDTTPSIRIAAEQARDLFIYQKREDGTGFYSFDFGSRSLDEIEANEWFRPMLNIIGGFAGHEDFAYDEVVAALEALGDWSDDADPLDCVDEMVETGVLALAQERDKREIWTGVIQALQRSAVREM